MIERDHMSGTDENGYGRIEDEDEFQSCFETEIEPETELDFARDSGSTPEIGLYEGIESEIDEAVSLAEDDGDPFVDDLLEGQFEGERVGVNLDEMFDLKVENDGQ